jgi:hypothetical protein
MNATIQMDANSKEKCWFCKKRKANPSSAVMVKMSKIRTIFDHTDPYKDPLYSVRVEFIDPSNLVVFVPSCKSCQSTQKFFHIMNSLSGFVKWLLNSLIWLFMLGLYFVNLVAFVVVVIICLIVAGIYLKGKWGSRDEYGQYVPEFIKHHLASYAYQHPEVQSLSTKYWIIPLPAQKVK